jgi:hypothetical protein
VDHQGQSWCAVADLLDPRGSQFHRDSIRIQEAKQCASGGKPDSSRVPGAGRLFAEKPAVENGGLFQIGHQQNNVVQSLACTITSSWVTRVEGMMVLANPLACAIVFRHGGHGLPTGEWGASAAQPSKDTQIHFKRDNKGATSSFHKGYG